MGVGVFLWYCASKICTQSYKRYILSSCKFALRGVCLHAVILRKYTYFLLIVYACVFRNSSLYCDIISFKGGQDYYLIRVIDIKCFFASNIEDFG